MDRAAPSIYVPVASGTVTQANMKISAVNGGATASGGAFVDFTAANVLTTKLGNLLVIKDSSSRKIQGFIKAAGTSETLDATNLVTEWTNVNYDSFTSVSSPDIAAAVYTTSGTQTATSNSMVTAVGKLYKLVATWTNVAGQAPTLTGTNGFKTTTLAAGANNIYFVATGTSIVITSTNTAAASWGCTFVLKQVLAPGTTGVTGVSTKGGATYNWAQKDAAFNYNDAAGYTYEIWKVLDAPVVASGNITAGALKADLTLTNAFAEFGVDLTAGGYQTGKYLLALYNTTGGYAAFGLIKSTAPGGETLSGIELAVDGNMETNPTVNWLCGNGTYAATLAVETIIVHGGSKSLKATRTGDKANSASALPITVVSGAAYKYVSELYAATGQGTPSQGWSTNNIANTNLSYMPAVYDSWNTVTSYFTPNATSIYIGTRAGGNFTWYNDDNSLQRLDDCATTGALITDMAGRESSFINMRPTIQI
jgi:hypothetical protein